MSFFDGLVVQSADAMPKRTRKGGGKGREASPFVKAIRKLEHGQCFTNVPLSEIVNQGRDPDSEKFLDCSNPETVTEEVFTKARGRVAGLIQSAFKGLELKEGSSNPFRMVCDRKSLTVSVERDDSMNME